MKNKLVTTIIVIILFVSCKKEDDKIIPITNYGSLTAEIDSINRNFTINMEKTTVDTGINSGIKFIVIEGMDLGSNTLKISIPSRDTGTFNIAYSIASSCRYTSKQGVVYYGKAGVAKLTKVDFINKKLSGTFTLKLLKLNSQDTIYLTNGVFTDLQLPKKQ
jgi:hypothetical protein